MTLVLDASVIVKWLLNSPQREPGTDIATRLMDLVASGEHAALQPAHWLLEAGAVLARESPASAADDIAMLDALELPVASDPLMLRHAVALAVELRQHVFDTAYHAVALGTPGAILVMADGRYFLAAQRKGHIVELQNWN